ncbi:MAG: SDR family oxidoreductase [Pseudomonadota bacterium]|nr:SDR family oxidoreductase [Pseudomonadota bacterium]
MTARPATPPPFRAAILTGASRGLGAALARALAARGTRVLLVGRAAPALDAVVAAIRAAGGDAHAFAADIADKHRTHAIAAAAEALVGPVDLLVHNASTLGPLPLRPLFDLACEDLSDVLETNLVGPFRLTRVVAGGMALRGRGTVLHISSDAATNAYPGWGAYGVSKAAQDHLARSFAADAEAAGARVRFLSVDPGEMDTRMHDDAIPGLSDAERAALGHPDTVAQRILATLDVAAPVAALPSDAVRA